MSEAIEGGVLDLDKEQRKERLHELEHTITQNLCGLALAVAEIFRDELYREADYDSFVGYCDDVLQRKKTIAYSLLAAGQVFPLLDSAIADKVHSESLFRPISGMKPENQAKVLKMAVQVSEKQGIRLTAKLVEDIAEKNFNWLPANKRKQQRKQQSEDPSEASAERRQQLFDGLEAIAGLGLGGFDAVQEFGDPANWPGFFEASQFVKDVEDAEIPEPEGGAE